MINCCGVCLYGKNKHKYSDSMHVECMLDNYSKKSIIEKCSSYKRDFSKDIQVVSKTQT